MKVLLVEDEEFIRDLFKRQLDLSGFTTDAFGTGQDGILALSKNAYDLVLLDIMLPDINGLQILQTIRQNPATKGVAVVLLTNLGQDAVIKQGFELGADGYLVKAAYTPDQIVQEVKNIMQKKQAQNLAHPPAPSLPGQSPMPPAQPQAPVTPAPVPTQTPVPPAPQSPVAPPSASDIVSHAASADTTEPITDTPEVPGTNS
jgi:DNA-binding response OmpR family regulator